MTESQHIEFKQKWKDEYLQYVSGFANAQGGTLFVGIDDRGEVCGIDNAKTLLEKIPNQIFQTMGIVAEVNLHTENGKEYLSISAKPSSQPISFRGKYYFRSGSTLQELNGTALRDFLFDKLGITFEDSPNDRATLDDIDRDAIDFFLRSAVAAGRITSDTLRDTTEKVLHNLDLVTEEGKLKNAAVLLFGKNPQRFFISSRFRLGRFGSRPSDLIFQDEVNGNILQMADRVIWLLRSKYLRTPIRYEGLHRIEDLEIPEPAMRELIYNAIVHRDYMGNDIQMKVYDDHIWLWNAGELPNGYNTEKLLKEHLSIPRNKLIASVFYKAGFIENWGRGFDKVINGFKAAELALPTIESEFGGTSVHIQRKVEKTLTDVETMDITERQKRIVVLLAENPSIGFEELAEKLSVSRRTVASDISALKKKNVIQRVGSDKNGQWEIVIN
ncbi:MAG: ATP-binding protein [Bacteroidales bacterium]|nr:ATP-binding protein [Bacteroidales bacterium]